MPGHVLRNGRLTHVDPQFQEFAVNSWRAPQRVGFRHRANQLADVPRNARSTQVASALRRPDEPEAATVPGEDRQRRLPRFFELWMGPSYDLDSAQHSLDHGVGGLN